MKRSRWRNFMKFNITTYENDDVFQSFVVKFVDKIRQSTVQHFIVGEIQLPVHVIDVAILHVLRKTYTLTISKQVLPKSFGKSRRHPHAENGLARFVCY